MESREACLTFRIVGGEVHEHADAPHALALLRPCRERPRCCAADERYELAPFQWQHLPCFQPGRYHTSRVQETYCIAGFPAA
jgi:hypothetical protein